MGCCESKGSSTSGEGSRKPELRVGERNRVTPQSASPGGLRARIQDQGSASDSNDGSESTKLPKEVRTFYMTKRVAERAIFVRQKFLLLVDLVFE